MRRGIIVCGMIAVLVLASSSAWADKVTLGGHNNSVSGTLYMQGSGVSYGNYYAGVYSWTASNPNPTNGAGQYVPNWGFCIELPQSPKNGEYEIVSVGSAPLPAQYGTPMGDAKAAQISELWARYFKPAWASGSDKAGAVAFAAAIWEIVYEDYESTASNYDAGSWDGSSGFRANDATVVSTANSWLASLDGSQSANGLVALTKSDGQDFLVQVPLPPAALLGLGLLGGLALVRRIRR